VLKNVAFLTPKVRAYYIADTDAISRQDSVLRRPAEDGFEAF
jgi:hypothetical protein